METKNENSDVSRAEEMKNQANEAFKGHKFSNAIDLYTKAIELNGNNAVYWANRAFAHTKLEEYGSAIQDASKAIEIDPKYSKGYYRRGAAYLAMGKFKDALKDFQQVKRICPNDPDAARKLKECEKAVMKMKFEEAISAPVSERRSVAESIDYHTIGNKPRSSSFLPTKTALAAVVAAVMVVAVRGFATTEILMVLVSVVLGTYWWGSFSEVEPQYSGARIEGEEVTLEFVKQMMEDFKNQKTLHKRRQNRDNMETKNENSDVSRAEEMKNQANEAFKGHKFSNAIDLYTKAIELNGNNAVYWANRAFAHTKLEEYGSAIQDASKAIEIDPKYSKGYYRRGAAYLAMGKFKDALKDFQQVKRICPNDPDAARKLKECEKAVMKMKFEEAISAPVSERRSVAESIDYHTIGNKPRSSSFLPTKTALAAVVAAVMVVAVRGFATTEILMVLVSVVLGTYWWGSFSEVEPQYSGARIEGEEVTLEFVKQMMEDFKNQKTLHKRYAYQIVLKTRQILQALPSLVDISVPNGKHFTVCGDVHGQFYDLLNIFELNGLPSEENPYLFNGDFVDRGSFSVEIILTLFAFKCMSPSSIYLARGNHESKSMNKIYGFEGEVRSKLSEKFVDLFAEVFCYLPLAHVINEKIFVVHGGLFSVDGVKLSDIRAIDRFCEPPEEGLMCELLWSDPQPLPGRGPSKRGVGLSFGGDVTKRFLEDNNLDLVVRSHEVKDEGYEVDHDGKLITVFSAPNYCDQMGNKGAFIRFEAPYMKPNIVTFSAVTSNTIFLPIVTLIGNKPRSSSFLPTKTALAAVVAAVMVVAVRGFATTEILMVLVSVVLGTYWWGSFSEVEPQYSGARIEGEEVTLEFVKQMMEDFKNQKTLHKRYAYQIVLKTRQILQALPSLVDISVPNGKHFTVCGDVHGQFYDLLNIFELNGLPSEENPYLFNGDFVDRGSFSVEIILTLFAFKCMSPSSIYLARGNHESKSMNKIYGFEGEVRSKLSEKFVDLFAEVFCYLPLAHVINEKIFVVHGGLFSVDGVKLSDIRAIDRFCEPPEEGLMCELLWSDPQPLPGRGPSKRGVGLSFGGDVTKRFLEDNNLDLVVRSHEVKDEGYEVDHDGKLITVFSAPNYCDQMGNKGAFIRFEAPYMKPNIVTFSAVPHPDVKPMAYANNFMRMFN
ncbi:hypothetical protein F2Q69_00017901 [Brassica cretica]|uniref:Serine/threonine-protein phosphatase 5 n=1 Tax=Brassica cretica TaxID=69181 RepID=A0A8S9QNH0_BRACR|nr:hypothetical protein F2Q69_00017901 [Brassica cretica]